MGTSVAKNPYVQPRVDPALVPPADRGVREFHRTLPGYAPTPLVSLPALAAELGLGALWIKDESKRFGLNAFKVLGASYAIHRFLQANPSATPTFATATDGNHGRAVAWAAKRLGRPAVIYVPSNTVQARIDSIRGEGAEVVVVDGTYDDTVRRAAADGAAKGFQVISDTAYPGYMEIPGWIMAGYATLFEESEEQGAMPDAVFLQAGVGGLACAGALHYVRQLGAHRPALVSVEPTDADCLLESIRSPNGEMRESKGKQNSIMAGLNCGTPSLLAWPVIRAAMHWFVAVDDPFAEDAMRRLARGTGTDPRVVSGESGAAGLAGLLALKKDAAAWDAMGLGPKSKVLLVSTEGDTDPVAYRKIVGAVA